MQKKKKKKKKIKIIQPFAGQNNGMIIYMLATSVSKELGDIVDQRILQSDWQTIIPKHPRPKRKS